MHLNAHEHSLADLIIVYPCTSNYRNRLVLITNKTLFLEIIDMQSSSESQCTDSEEDNLQIASSPERRLDDEDDDVPEVHLLVTPPKKSRVQGRIPKRKHSSKSLLTSGFSYQCVKIG